VRKSPSGAPDESQCEDEVSKSESTTLTNSVFPVGSLSPPSQIYDASLAVKNAINHNDLADYDATHRDSSMLDMSGANNGGNMLESPSTNRTGPIGAEFIPGIRNPNKLISANGPDQVQVVCHRPKRTHRPSCRYFHRTFSSKENKQEKQKSDDTVDDISLPSGFLESETSVHLPPKSITSDASTKHKRNKAKSHFPSIGGSPTRDGSNFKFPLPPQRTTLVAKKTLSVANSVGVMPTKKSHGKSVNRTSPSTPDGFWNIDLEQHDKGKENVPVTNTTDTEVNIQHSSRRRRPLNFPSFEISPTPI
ncbi:unnamed protein product, partial [Schistosoma curassoni]|uniref:Protein kinase domain-containing protein n=1 Tax=Schistosoma curassoni TaxID=6186 RepID=A0A183KKS1_9TREM